MIYRPHMTSTDLRALVADPFTPDWDLAEGIGEIVHRARIALRVVNQPVQGPVARVPDLVTALRVSSYATGGRRSVDDEDADIEGDRYESDIYRRSE